MTRQARSGTTAMHQKERTKKHIKISGSNQQMQCIKKNEPKKCIKKNQRIKVQNAYPPASGGLNRGDGFFDKGHQNASAKQA
jgi:hypothetical protein